MSDVINTLNALIETTKDGEKGFLNAAKHAHSPLLKSLFTEYSADCSKAAIELQQRVKMLGGEPETSGTTVGALHRGWMDLKTSVTSSDDLALLEECERGEDHAKARFAEALNSKLTSDDYMLVDRLYKGTLRHHDRIKALRNQEAQSA